MKEKEILATRRAVLAGAGMAAISTLTPLSAASLNQRFPQAFRWGASTAGHQIEGNNTNSDLWLMENIKETTFKERSGDACDSYNRWRQDIALLKALGLNTYRMSIEWARIEPSPGQFSNAELDHYKVILADLHAAGITPAITFFHTAAPRWFAEAGGWLNPDSPDLFARYCDRAVRALGDAMGYAFTINEPQVGLTYRTFPQSQAYFKSADEREARAHAEAAHRTGVERFVTMNAPDIKAMTPQLLAAHKKGFAAIKAAQPRLPTGVTLNLVDFQPGNEGSKFRELRELAYGLWMDAVKRDGDFVGVQTYRQVQIPGAGAKLPAQPAMPFVSPSQQNELIKQPSALRNTVEYVHERTGKPVFVTENGIDTENDARRAWYMVQVLAGLHEAIAKGVPVLGYLHWSLLDNFEWQQGYGPKFGLASVDRATFKRTLKPSSAIYSRIVRRNAV
ncbi:MAG: family 1 glycosylhydrolase [Sphingomicrobium sp.]